MNMLDFDSLNHQLDSFRASDAAREDFIRNILERHQQLVRDHEMLKHDFAAEQSTRRSYQTTLAQKENFLNQYQRQFENSSFVLALIDGDGAIFQDALLQAAHGDGGSEAASRLYHTIQKHMASLYSNSSHWPIMVQVYLSLEKLAIKLAQVGLIQTPQELRIFAQRFSVNQPLFSIIDVGHGKERADHKIKEMLRTFSDNPTCRHIIFGGCHDAGYLLNLEQFKHDAIKAGRITLLETTTMFRGFAELSNFKCTRFDDVFKSEPLPEAPVNTVVVSRSPKQAPVRPLVRSTTNHEASPTRPPRNSVVSPSPSVTPSTATAESSETNGDSWATVGKTSVQPNVSIPITHTPAPTKKTNKKYAYYNKTGERLDLPLPPKDPAAAQSLEARMKKSGKKMCNHWHLGNKCDNGKNCMFQHEPKLSPAELNALRYKTRSLPCKNRYCENIDCYLGHQCAMERDQGYCNFPSTCHMRATHGMDTVKWVRYDREGNAENAP